MMLPKKLRDFIKSIYYAGDRRHCNICGKSSRRFLDWGIEKRPEARCPFCGSLERHRLTYEFLRKNTNWLSSEEFCCLHVAPERCFREIFRARLGQGYITADLMNPAADFQWDITAIPQPEATFDAIYCSHVLEHVVEDRRAMAEFFRVLKPGGWAVLNVPITANQTIEDPTVTDPQQRLRLYGQSDHVRRYGPDYIDRLNEAGFNVEIFAADDLFNSSDMDRFALRNEHTGVIHFCRKPQ